jgi:hypothetical protein
MAAALTDRRLSMSDLAETEDAALPKPGKRGTYKKPAAPNNLAPITYALALSGLVSACSSTSKKPIPGVTADEALAVQTRVIDCEWKAANQYDDSRYKTMAELAQRVMDACTVERLNARLAFGLSANDSRIDADELKEAAENIETARKKRLRP